MPLRGIYFEMHDQQWVAVWQHSVYNNTADSE